MTKVMSTRQLVANRRNAKRSTGPRTRRGKAAIAKNNLRHGLLPREIVLSSPNAPESRADFAQLFPDLINQLHPLKNPPIKNTAVQEGYVPLESPQTPISQFHQPHCSRRRPALRLAFAASPFDRS